MAPLSRVQLAAALIGACVAQPSPLPLPPSEVIPRALTPGPRSSRPTRQSTTTTTRTPRSRGTPASRPSSPTSSRPARPGGARGRGRRRRRTSTTTRTPRRTGRPRRAPDGLGRRSAKRATGAAGSPCRRCVGPFHLFADCEAGRLAFREGREGTGEEDLAQQLPRDAQQPVSPLSSWLAPLPLPSCPVADPRSLSALLAPSRTWWPSAQSRRPTFAGPTRPS